jgi:hypothetical protein
MPPRIKIAALALLISASLFSARAADEDSTQSAPHPFRYDTDTFSFANETVWNYVGGSVQAGSPQTPAQKRDYTRRCFVVTRAAVQFWKFARFDSHAAPLASDALAARIREVTARSVWLPALAESQRIVFPGYANLRELSASDPSLFQANLGLGWPVYFRVGNMPIAAPVYRETEARLNGEIFRALQQNEPSIVWLYNFPSLNINHVVVVFSGSRDHDRFDYQVYDPNYSSGPKKLEYDVASRTFSYQPTFYFKGGTVEAHAIYRGVFR